MSTVAVLGRRISGAVLASGLLITGATVAASPAVAFSQTVVEFRASSTAVPVGGSLVITLSVQPRMSNRVVTLQSSVNGRGGWQTVQRLRTDRTGVVSWSVVMQSSSALFYRAVVAGTTRYSPATSEVIKITASKTRTTLTVDWPEGDTVAGGDQITGRVTPTTAGRNVILEAFDDGLEEWMPVDTDRTDSRGLYDLTLDDEQGTIVYRVRVPATARATAAVSDEVELTFDDGSGRYDVSLSWPSGNISEDSIVSGVVSGLEDGSYDVLLEFVDPDSGEWTADGTEAATVDFEISDFSISFYGLSGYSGPLRVVIVDQYGDQIYASDPEYVDVA